MTKPSGRWRKFFRDELWHLDPAGLTRLRRSLVHGLQVLLLVGEGFTRNRLLLWASALTSATMLSIVPLLAFMFALLKGLGVQARLEALIVGQLAAGSQETITRILDYINKVNVGSLGAIGLVLLILLAVLVLDNVESAFNVIWSIPRRRALARKYADYLTLLVMAPIFLLLALSLTATLKSMIVVTWVKFYFGPAVMMLLRLAPFVAVWVALVFLFMFMPNARVRFWPALAAGVLTGTVWQAMQWVYITFQVGVSRYNAIYGTLAQLPVMLVWIFISWVIVLFGAELNFALQNVAAYRRERRFGGLSFAGRTDVALRLVRAVHARYHSGEAPWTVDDLAGQLDVPVSWIQSILDDIHRLGYLVPVAGGTTGAWVPARDLSRVSVDAFLDEWERLSPPHPATIRPASRPLAAGGGLGDAADWLAAARAARRKALGQTMIVESSAAARVRLPDAPRKGD